MTRKEKENITPTEYRSDYLIDHPWVLDILDDREGLEGDINTEYRYTFIFDGPQFD